MDYITAIKNYVLYLKKECSLSVTLHSFQSRLLLKKELLVFNIHENPYCIFVKSCKNAQTHCIEKQAKIIEKCQNGSFCGVCHAGVREYVYPIRSNDTVVGFVCVSGFACKNSNEYIKAISLKYDLSYDALHETYQSLKPEMPPKPYVDTLINPLCYMLELAHIKSSKNIRSEQSLIERIKQYIRTNYTQDITSQTLCHKFNCSRSHLSRIFNEEMKTSIREHITSLRIESAKMLLRDTRLEIAEIAMAIGFSEPNYFTTIFKKYTNLTPSAYRKSYS